MQNLYLYYLKQPLLPIDDFYSYPYYLCPYYCVDAVMMIVIHPRELYYVTGLYLVIYPFDYG